MVPSPDMSLESIKHAIEDISGYPYEQEIVRRIETHSEYGYWVEPNYSFEDPDTGEARELDFHATIAKSISIKKHEFAFTIILGSCKANRYPYIFFTRRLPFAGITLNSDTPIAGCPLEIYDESGEREAIDWYYKLHDFLHIAKMDIVSSQFCSLVWKNNKWEIQPEAIFRNTFIPLLKAMSREIDDYNKRSIPDINEESPDYKICYPLLVLKGPMLEHHMPSSGPPQLREVKHVLFIRHYESKSIKCRYAIDVIHESYIEDYLNIINKELKRFVNKVKYHKKAVVRSMKKIAELEEDKKQVEGGLKSE